MLYKYGNEKYNNETSVRQHKAIISIKGALYISSNLWIEACSVSSVSYNWSKLGR